MKKWRFKNFKFNNHLPFCFLTNSNFQVLIGFRVAIRSHCSCFTLLAWCMLSLCVCLSVTNEYSTVLAWCMLLSSCVCLSVCLSQTSRISSLLATSTDVYEICLKTGTVRFVTQSYAQRRTAEETSRWRWIHLTSTSC